jgi:hypothetical protein
VIVFEKFDARPPERQNQWVDEQHSAGTHEVNVTM